MLRAVSRRHCARQRPCGVLPYTQAPKTALEESMMKTVLGTAVLCLGLAGLAHAQADAFNGLWKVDLSRSTAGTTQLPQQEFLTLQVTATGETAINDVTGTDGVRRKSSYTATYNDGKWYPSKSLDTGQTSGATVAVVR